MPQIKHLFLLLICCVLISPSYGKVAVNQGTSSEKQSLQITIYPLNLALVKDSREVMLLEGDNKVNFFAVSPALVQDSFLLRTLDNSALIFSEVSFQQNPLTFKGLLFRFANKMVVVFPKKSSIMNSTPVTARLLAATQKEALIEFNGIVSRMSLNQIAFPGLPQGVSRLSSVKMRIKSPKSHKHPIELTYLTRGLNWQTDYTIEVDPQSGLCNMIGWVMIQNKSGVGYRNASIQLASHNPSARESQAYRMPLFYPIPEPVNLHDGATKRVIFLNAPQIKSCPLLRIQLPFTPGKKLMHSIKLNTQRWFRIQNVARNKLGFLIPPGKIRVYANDQKNQIRFVGTTKLGNTKVNAFLDIPINASPLIDARFEQTDFRPLGRQFFESTYRVDLTNKQGRVIHLSLTQDYIPDSSITYSTHKYYIRSGKIFWGLVLQPNESVALRYRVRSLIEKKA
jgi:hypothetical protein